MFGSLYFYLTSFVQLLYKFCIDMTEMQAMSQQGLFPISAVSQLTGVNSVTLRAWERRYGLIKPTRTEADP